MQRASKFVAASVWAAVVTGCATDFAGHTDSPKPAPRQPVAEVDGELLDEMSLGAKAHERLWRIDDAYAQERLVALWAGIEDAVGDRLLSAEARRRRIDVATLLRQEVDDKIGATTDAEVRALYDSHQTVIATPFEKAAPALRAQARLDRTRALRRALVDRLRERAQVQLRLPRVGLHRKAMAGVGPSLGPADAPITLVVFSDFACPYSAQARRTVRRLSELYGNDLRVVHRNFPLPQHPGADAMAVASLCADAQGKFWPFYDKAFEHDGQLGEPLVDKVAAAAGVDVALLQACKRDPRIRESLMHDIADGKAAGVRGTPSMFLNGMPLRGVLPLPVMQSLIDQERSPVRAARIAPPASNERGAG